MSRNAGECRAKKLLTPAPTIPINASTLQSTLQQPYAEALLCKDLLCRHTTLQSTHSVETLLCRVHLVCNSLYVCRSTFLWSKHSAETILCRVHFVQALFCRVPQFHTSIHSQLDTHPKYKVTQGTSWLQNGTQAFPHMAENSVHLEFQPEK